LNHVIFLCDFVLFFLLLLPFICYICEFFSSSVCVIDTL